MIWGIGEPYVTFGAWQAAVSYERKFTEHHSIVLDGSVVLVSGPHEECDPSTTRYSGSVSYRYYFISDRKFMNRFWLSPGLKYQKIDLQACYEEGLSDFYGIRFMVGKQVTSYGYRIFSYIKETDSWGNVTNTIPPDPYLIFIPEFVFRVGIRF